MKKVLKNIISFLLTIFLIISVVLFNLGIYIKNDFETATFEQLYLTLFGTKGTSVEAILDGVIFVGSLSLVMCALLLIPYILEKIVKKKITFQLSFRKKLILLRQYPSRISNLLKGILILVLVYFFLENVGLWTYLESQRHLSHLYEDEYVDPAKVNVEFEEKRNLIYIFVESLESSYQEVTLKNEKVNLIPNLYKIAEENINYSYTKEVGGAYPTTSTGWTIAGNVAQTAGINFALSIGGNAYTNEYKEFLPGAYSLGEILEKNGYKNYYLMGEDDDFAGTGRYFTKHGHYEVLDYKKIIKKKYVPKDYHVNWGVEDSKIFEIAKEQILKAAENDELFNYTIATIDTHFPGYVDELCDEEFDNLYADSIHCEDYLLSEFISWVQEQDFYDNTTIIVSGDHLTMSKADFLPDIPKPNRTIYNVFINSPLNPEYSKNRVFSPVDMYPTTLAAIGAKIEGNRLGLGTNLDSGEKTLYEKYGIDYVNKDLALKSNYYNRYILKGDYLKMIEQDNTNK